MVKQIAFLLAAAAVASPGAVTAQQGEPLQVGAQAPDFEVVGATRFGVLRDAVRLSEYRGKTVVLAFFYRVRTPG